jgi:hypothetical protein
MKKFRACFLILGVLLCGAPAFGQNPVYVSGGPYIYNVQGSSLVTVYDATIITPTTGNAYTGPYYSSLAVGPDYADVDPNGNALYPFLIYACDTNTNTIIRFAPTGTLNPPTDIIYNGSIPGLTPQCGRFSSTGDFYITNQSGTIGGANDVYKFSNLANLKLGMGGGQFPTAVSLGLPSGFTGAGITQKNVGDLLLVDMTDNEVLRAPYGPPFGTATSYITGLSSPVGIARTSTGDVFVANAGSSTVAHFNSAGAPASTCPTLTFSGAGNTSLFSLAASETDVIYAAASQPTSSPDYTEDLDFQAEGDDPGQVWSWSAAQLPSCVLQSVAFSETQLSGVAVAPIPTAPIQQHLNATAATPTPATFSFNSNEFQIIAGNNCTATVTAYQLSLANINSMISKAGLPNGGTPIVNLGEGGYEIGYEAKWPDSLASPACTAVLNGEYANFIFGLYDPNLSSNPEIIRCDDSNVNNEPNLDSGASCEALTLIGSYPLGGPIPNDNGAGGGGTKNSVFFLANANPTTVVTEQGQFCGFIPPNGKTFDTDDFVVVAFQLAQKTGNCQTGPFIGDAQVLLSVAETAPTFAPILQLKTVGNLGTTFPEPNHYPIPCNSFPHSKLACTYALVIDVQKSGLTPGTYSLSAQPVTGNAGTEAITFTVVPESPNHPF